MTGGAQTLHMPITKSDTQAVPTQNDQCHTILQEADSLSSWCKLRGSNQRQCPMYKVYKRLFKNFWNAETLITRLQNIKLEPEGILYLNA